MYYAVAAYCALCWAIGWVCIRGWSPSGCAAGQRTDGRRVLARIMTVATAPIWIVIGFVLFVPRVLIAVGACKEAWKQSHRYREPMFQPLTDAPSHTRVRRAFDDASATFTLLGFSHVGDYLNKPEPMVVYNRYLLSPDGTSVADITVMDDEVTPSFLSLLADGTCVQSVRTGLEGLGSPEECDRMHFVDTSGLSVRESFETHTQTVAIVAGERNTEVLVLNPEQVPALALYEQRLFWTWRRRQGEVTDEIPTPQMPAGQPLPLCESIACRPSGLGY